MSAFESGADASLTSQQLKRLTNKMAETKRLIKEFEKTALREGAMDVNALAAAKKEYVSKLNRFVQMKKDAQAALVAREAERQSAGATATEARTSAAGPSTAPSAVETAFALPAFKPRANKGEILEEEQLQQMEAGDLITHGRNVLDETDKSLARSEAVVEETIQIGAQTAEALRGQTHQLEKVVDDLDEIHFSLKKSFDVIRDITRGLATDKCIMLLLFLIIAGVLTVIILKVVKK